MQLKDIQSIRFLPRFASSSKIAVIICDLIDELFSNEMDGLSDRLESLPMESSIAALEHMTSDELITLARDLCIPFVWDDMDRMRKVNYIFEYSNIRMRFGTKYALQKALEAIYGCDNVEIYSFTDDQRKYQYQINIHETEYASSKEYIRALDYIKRVGRIVLGMYSFSVEVVSKMQGVESLFVSASSNVHSGIIEQ